MKKIRKTVLMALTVIVIVAFVGCTKDNDNSNNGGNSGGDQPNTDTINNGGGNYEYHEYVDLGLPSGTLWATCDVGATSPEDFGSLFAWGETAPKETYNWKNYKWCTDEVIGFGDIGNGLDEDTLYRLTKYCGSLTFNGYNGYHDTLTVLQPSDDAATANWGNGWRMPTGSQWGELSRNTIATQSFQNGIRGILLTASNGESLFFSPESLEIGYWLPNLSADGAFGRCGSVSYVFNTEGGDFSRASGHAVRPVRSSN